MGVGWAAKQASVEKDVKPKVAMYLASNGIIIKQSCYLCIGNSLLPK